MAVGARDRAPRPGRARRRPSSRSASRCARRSSSPPAREREAIERLGRRRARRAQRQGAALRRRRPTSSARYEVKPNYRALGPRFGKHMPQVAAAVAALDPDARGRRAARRAAASASPSTATTTSSAPTTSQLAMQPLEGYQLEREGSHAVALDLDARRRAAPRGPGARDRPRGPGRAQGRRPRRRGPHRAARSAATTSCSRPRARTRSYVAGETLATSVSYDGLDGDAATTPASRAASCASAWSARPRCGAWPDPGAARARGGAVRRARPGGRRSGGLPVLQARSAAGAARSRPTDSATA